MLVAATMFGFLLAHPGSVGNAFPPPQAEPDIFFPPGTVINVKTDYGARGDGVTDDTQAILKAIRENINKDVVKGSFIYFPAGTYLVSDRLDAKDNEGVWHAKLQLLGQNRSNTTIKLKDNAPGFDDPKNPKAVIFTAAMFFRSETAGGKDWPGLGEGNTAFRNNIFDLTVDTGSGNPGAIGIDYLTSNRGAIRNVTIRSGDGQGHTGLSMTRKWPGPGLVTNLRVVGFDTGIAMAHPIYSMTFEHISLENQQVVGIFNQNNLLAIRDLESNNSGSAIRNVGPSGLIVLLDGNLKGGSPSVSAVENDAGEVYVRNVDASGYQSIIKNRGLVVPGASIAEYVSRETPLLFDVPRASLNLPIKETPTVPQDPVDKWANATDFGADGTGDRSFDNTRAFQAAIDSGATTVYVPKGRYLFKDTIHIRGNVRRIDFMQSWIGLVSNHNFGADRPIFRFEDGAHPVVLLERLGSFWAVGDIGNAVVVEHSSPRTLVVRNSGMIFGNSPGSGPLFLEDIGMGLSNTFTSQEVWARQLNPEGVVENKILNDGSKMWILGLKTEMPGTVITTVGGGQTELLGAFIFPVHKVKKKIPIFINDESSHSLVYLVHARSASRNHQIQIRETIDGQVKILSMEQAIGRGAGSIVPLHAGYSETAPPVSVPTPTPPDGTKQTPTLTSVPPPPDGIPAATPVPPAAPGKALQKLVEAFEKIAAASNASAQERAGLELIDLLQRDAEVEEEFRNFRDSLQKALQSGDISQRKADEFLRIMEAVADRTEG